MNLAGCFIKFGELEHISQLHEKGLLYCNPINYFIDLEDKQLRGDEYENVIDLVYMESGEVLIGKPEEIPIKEGIKMPFKDARITGRIIEPFGNLFCLYCINLLDKPIGEIFQVDERVKQFGEYFLLIHDSHEFLRRVKTELYIRKLPFSSNIVQYLDLTKHTGKKSVFQKHIAYQYQQEYRIFINNNEAEAITIEIGSLADISVLCKSENIEHLMVKGIQHDETNFTILSNIQR